MKKICKIVELETNDTKNVLCYQSNWDKDLISYYHLYVVSDDEIKVGDWMWSNKTSDLNPMLVTDISLNVIISKKGNFVGNITNFKRSDCKKIIATTDPKLNLPDIDAEFKKIYTKQSGIYTIYVDYVVGCVKEQNSNEFIKYNEVVIIDNCIKITPCKEQYSKSEVITICKKLLKSCEKEVDYPLSDMFDINEFL
jgi:hypothetical protein